MKKLLRFVFIATLLLLVLISYYLWTRLYPKHQESKLVLTKLESISPKEVPKTIINQDINGIPHEEVSQFVKENFIINLGRLIKAHDACTRNIEKDFIHRGLTLPDKDSNLLSIEETIKSILIIQSHRFFFNNKTRDLLSKYRFLYFPEKDNDKNLKFIEGLPQSLILSLLEKIIQHSECYTTELKSIFDNYITLNGSKEEIDESIPFNYSDFPTELYFKEFIHLEKPFYSSHDYDKEKAKVVLDLAKEVETDVIRA